MKTTQRIEKFDIRRFGARRLGSLVVILAAASTLTACGHTMAMIRGTGARRPPSSEFGLGPRSSVQGRYVATLEPDRQLRPRQMQTVRVTVVDRTGHAIEDATLTIDGGMPQHGHGLPTRPRVTKSLGAGVTRSKACVSTWAAGGSSRSRSRPAPARTPSRSIWTSSPNGAAA